MANRALLRPIRMPPEIPESSSFAQCRPRSVCVGRPARGCGGAPADVSIAALLDTVEDRRRALVGFVLAPLQVSALIRHISQEITSDVVFDVYDSTVGLAAPLGGSPPADRGPYHLTQSVRVGDNRQWIVLVSSRAGPSDGMITQAAERTQLVGTAFFAAAVPHLRRADSRVADCRDT